MWKKGEVTASLDEEEDHQHHQHHRRASELQLITARPAPPPGSTPLSAVRVAVQEMESEINERMSAISTSIADSTDTRVSDLIEAGYGNTKLSSGSPSLTCASSIVRNFGNTGTLIHGLNSSGDGAVFRDCDILDGSLVAKHFYARGEYLKCDSVPWVDFVNVQETNVAPSESLPGASLNLSAATGACKFIKDEKEPSVIMETPCPSFDPSSEIPALDTCCQTNNRKQQLGLSDSESNGFTPAALVPRPGLEGSPNFLIDLNQPEREQLPALSQVRTDSRCGLSGKAVTSFDANRHTAPQLTMYKSEVPRWQMQTSPAEPQYWVQSAGLTEEPFTHSGYDGIQSQLLSQRNPSPFSAFLG